MSILTAARLVGIWKLSDGVRPIVVGECLRRRLAAKCLHSAVLAKVSEYFLPLQVESNAPV